MVHQKHLNTVEKVLFLKSVDLFKHAAIEELGRIAALTEEVGIDAGETIYREGEPTDAIYLIVQGRVLLEKNKQLVGTVEQRGIFGAVAALDLSPAVHTVTAQTSVHALKLNIQDFHDLLSMDFELVKTVFHFLCQMIRHGE